MTDHRPGATHLAPAGPARYPERMYETLRNEIATAPVRGVFAEVLEGPDRGRSCRGDELSVGTAESSELRLTDPAVSRFHLELRATDRGFSLIDHGSTNGTWIGAVRIERATVPAGTVVRLGSSALQLGETQPLQVELHGSDRLGELVGRAPVMRRMMARVAKAAQSDVSVLVTGESGTGKELVARALHELGPRRAGPLVTVDCGSLPATLVASELFGHEKGAFTGADRTHLGAFEAAAGGTVFLDEIGELQPAVQATLLGVLERRRLRRLGSRHELPVDVRVIAATHRDLRGEVNGGTFRLDLFYRLAVVGITLPPLRERVEDIPLLVEHFLRDCGWTQPTAALISPAVMEGLCRHHFAGNVRELRNLVEAAVAMGEPPPLEAGATAAASEALTVDLSAPYKDARAALMEEFEARYVAALMERADGNVSAAARMARMARSHLNDLLTKQRR
ncbi:MAG: sigma 54-dependent Fis family transcriptional regulator [Myxococcales bacterium]|nr:sigma 54-dependent Fis family transcriptional regulator [Myxococcales bacterium]